MNIPVFLTSSVSQRYIIRLAIIKKVTNSLPGFFFLFCFELVQRRKPSIIMGVWIKTWNSYKIVKVKMMCTLLIPLTTLVLFWRCKRFLGQACWWFSYVPFYEVPNWYFVSNCNTLCMILYLVCRKKRLIKVVSSSISTNLNTYMNSTYVLYINKITFQSSYLST